MTFDSKRVCISYVNSDDNLIYNHLNNNIAETVDR